MQNVGQLKQHYNKSWETFFANAGVVTAFGISDFETLKTLSDWLGDTGITEKVDSGTSRQAQLHGALTQHDDRKVVPLLAQHELRLLFGRGRKRALVFNVESEPAVVKRFFYYEKGSMFDGKYDPDPQYEKRP